MYRNIINPKYKELEAFLRDLPTCFSNEGEVIHKGRNELRLFNVNGYSLVVKSFQKPHLINRFVYGLFRASKAERSYLYAKKLLHANIGTPEPVGYITESNKLLFNSSFYISLKSECPNQYYDLNNRYFDRREEILQAIGIVTARMHENGFLHKDYSGGNILFNDKEELIRTEIIDLNRMSFGKINMHLGCKNFERLTASEETLITMGKAYAKSRGFNERECISLIKKYNTSWK